jgi:hypothetical protein
MFKMLVDMPAEIRGAQTWSAAKRGTPSRSFARAVRAPGVCPFLPFSLRDRSFGLVREARFLL